jgi:hypothetical protein
MPGNILKIFTTSEFDYESIFEDHSHNPQISSNLAYRRGAVHSIISKDEDDIRAVLRALLEDKNERAAIMNLERDEAMAFIASVQKVSNHFGFILLRATARPQCMQHSAWLSDNTIQYIAHRRITGLYLNLRIFPEDMLLEGVTYAHEGPFVPIKYGGCSKIYTGMYQGKVVALKEVRMPKNDLEVLCCKPALLLLMLFASSCSAEKL